MIAKIAVSAANFAIDKPYSYLVPEEMVLAPGQRVQVPFGRGNRESEGIILAADPGEKAEGVKSISALQRKNLFLLNATRANAYFVTFVCASVKRLQAREYSVLLTADSKLL